MSYSLAKPPQVGELVYIPFIKEFYPPVLYPLARFSGVSLQTDAFGDTYDMWEFKYDGTPKSVPGYTLRVQEHDLSRIRPATLPEKEQHARYCDPTCVKVDAALRSVFGQKRSRS